MKKKLLALLSLLVLALGLVACGKASNIEKFYSNAARKVAMEKQLEDLKSQYSDVYSDIGYSVSGNTFTYTYTFKNPVDDASAAKSSLESNLTSSVVNPAIDAIEQESGVTGVSLQYIYYNSDGTEIFNKTFSK